MNKHIEIDGVNFTLIPIIPFEQWIETRYGGIDKFRELSFKNKEKIFLRWKWGFEDEGANESLEASEKVTLFQFKDADLTKFTEPTKFWFENKKQFDKICYETKVRIGLISKSNPLVDKLMETFDATQTDLI